MKDLACSIIDAAINSRVVAARAASVLSSRGCGCVLSDDREPLPPSSSSFVVSVWICNSRSLHGRTARIYSSCNHVPRRGLTEMRGATTLKKARMPGNYCRGYHHVVRGQGALSRARLPPSWGLCANRVVVSLLVAIVQCLGYNVTIDSNCISAHVRVSPWVAHARSIAPRHGIRHTNY